MLSVYKDHQRNNQVESLAKVKVSNLTFQRIHTLCGLTKQNCHFQSSLLECKNATNALRSLGINTKQ